MKDSPPDNQLATVVCGNCRRTIGRDMAGKERNASGKTVYVCKRTLTNSCRKIASARAPEPARPAGANMSENPVDK